MTTPFHRQLAACPSCLLPKRLPSPPPVPQRGFTFKRHSARNARRRRASARALGSERRLRQRPPIAESTKMQPNLLSPSTGRTCIMPETPPHPEPHNRPSGLHNHLVMIQCFCRITPSANVNYVQRLHGLCTDCGVGDGMACPGTHVEARVRVGNTQTRARPYGGRARPASDEGAKASSSLRLPAVQRR